MTWRELDPENLFELRNPIIIDVRSPSEFNAEKIPNALNIPLLTDRERAEIGTIYKNDGELVARRHALKFISQKVPAIIDEIFSRRSHGQQVIVYCWRGGLRSEAVASLLSIAGIFCLRLTGGYKAWRKMVLSDLQADRFNFSAVVLHGMTGTGKTEILTELQKLNHQTLDLESLANHRGSTFGSMGLGKQPGQKDFESTLWWHLRTIQLDKPVFLEAESRKIGKLSVPDCVLSRVNNGRAILVHGNVDMRADRLAADYMQHYGSTAEATLEGIALLEQLRPFISRKLHDAITTLAKSGEIREAIKLLLVEYYDPLYLQSIKRRGDFEFEVCGDNAAMAAREIAKHVCKDKPVEECEIPALTGETRNS